MSVSSTPPVSPLLKHTFFGDRRTPRITQAVVHDTVAGPIAELEQKVQGVQSNRPSESKQKLLDSMQEILNTCLQPSSPLNVFGS